MGGLMSRRKGIYGEYALRDYLRQRGWTADRVPSSGAAQGKDFKGDVKASKDGKEVLFEMKFRKNEFKNIYALYQDFIKTRNDDLMAFVYPYVPKQLISISTSLDGLFDDADYYTLCSSIISYKQFSRTYKKIANMQKLLGSAQVLVIKDNNKPLLFIRYR